MVRLALYRKDKGLESDRLLLLISRDSVSLVVVLIGVLIVCHNPIREDGRGQPQHLLRHNTRKSTRTNVPQGKEQFQRVCMQLSGQDTTLRWDS